MSTVHHLSTNKPSSSLGTAPVEYEIIDAEELARRFKLKSSWIRDATRTRAVDPIPHLKFGRYVRFRWNSPELNRWIEQHFCSGGARR